MVQSPLNNFSAGHNLKWTEKTFTTILACRRTVVQQHCYIKESLFVSVGSYPNENINGQKLYLHRLICMFSLSANFPFIWHFYCFCLDSVTLNYYWMCCYYHVFIVVLKWKKHVQEVYHLLMNYCVWTLCHVLLDSWKVHVLLFSGWISLIRALFLGVWAV